MENIIKDIKTGEHKLVSLNSDKTEVLILDTNSAQYFTLKLCDYSTKPNVTFSKLGITVDDGLSFNI